MKVNNIAAAKEQLQTIMESIEVNKHMYIAADSSIEESLNDITDDDFSVNVSEHDTKRESMENTPLQNAFSQLNTILDELITLITSQVSL